MGKKEEAREERKLKFIESLKRRQARDLLEPLGQKIEAFLEGKLNPDDVFKTVHYVAVQSEKVTKRYRNRPDVVLAEIAMDENKFTTDINDVLAVSGWFGLFVSEGVEVAFDSLVARNYLPGGVMTLDRPAPQ